LTTIPQAKPQTFGLREVQFGARTFLVDGIGLKGGFDGIIRNDNDGCIITILRDKRQWSWHTRKRKTKDSWVGTNEDT